MQIVCILEFKQSTDRDEGFLKVKEAAANEQHKSIISALNAAAPKWEFEQIAFVWWETADRLSKATSTPSSKSLMYKKEKKTSSLPHFFRPIYICVSETLPPYCLFYVTMNIYFCFLFLTLQVTSSRFGLYLLNIYHFT